MPFGAYTGSQSLVNVILFYLCVLVSYVKNPYISEVREYSQPCTIIISIPCLMIHLL